MFQRDSVAKWLKWFKKKQELLVRNVVLNLITIKPGLKTSNIMTLYTVVVFYQR